MIKKVDDLNIILIERSDIQSLMNILGAKRGNIQTIGIMTAENPMAQPTSKQINLQLNKELETRLRAMNLGYKKIRGKFGNMEDSFLIPNVSREEMVNLGKEFKQESVIWGKKIGRGSKFEFQYIESESGTTSDTRSVVLSGEDVQAREDFFSQSRKGPAVATSIPLGKYSTRMVRLRKKHGNTIPAASKFVIPFFEDPNSYEVVEEYSLPNPEYSGTLVQEINERISKTLEENRTPKSKWFNRGILKKLYQETWKS